MLKNSQILRCDGMNPLIVGPHITASVSDVRPLFPDFDSRYVNGWAWLDRKLDDSSSGSANVWLMLQDAAIVALAIESLKESRSRKLSTFVVAPGQRNKGYGLRLLSHLRSQWCSYDVDRVHVTIDEKDLHTQEFFLKNHFQEELGALVPYGQRGMDKVFSWQQDRGQPGRDSLLTSHAIR